MDATLTPLATLPFAIRGEAEQEQIKAIEAVVAARRRSTRLANLGPFSGYRIGLDLGNGNIGWSLLFEDGVALRFMDAEAIEAVNKSLPPGAKRLQLPNLKDFVPLGTHKFEARDADGKSLSRLRAEGAARRGTLDARQMRRHHIKKALKAAGLWPADDMSFQGSSTPANRLRTLLLNPSRKAAPHDLGRALYNALKRRGYHKTVGILSAEEPERFELQIDTRYRQALVDFGCKTIGDFLNRCADDAKADKVRFRRRHRTLADQNKDNKGDYAKAKKSYEVFRHLTPSYKLFWEEACLLRERQASAVAIDDAHWAAIKKAADFRRPLQLRQAGACEYLEGQERCLRALPSFDLFRIWQQVAHLRISKGAKKLEEPAVEQLVSLLARQTAIPMARLAKEHGFPALRFDKGDDEGKRTLLGAKTDCHLAEALGERWFELPLKERDHWVLRLLRRDKKESWDPDVDGPRLKADVEAAFGPGKMEAAEMAIGKLAKGFAKFSARAAELWTEGYRDGLDHDAILAALRREGGRQESFALFEQLPYYGQVLKSLVVPAASFAPESRTAVVERVHGRAANPDVHIVLNRLRKVVNAVIGMMGGLLPTHISVEVARGTMSEKQAEEHSKKTWMRAQVRKAIEAEIRALCEELKRPTPRGIALDRVVERWKAALRQGWRDYDGSEIPRSALLDAGTYELDHVMPARFGEGRENNLFVSKFNGNKGGSLPWQAFVRDSEQGRLFRAALTAFAIFGYDHKIADLEKLLAKLKKNPKAKKRIEDLAGILEDARKRRSTLRDEEAAPHVLHALRQSGREAEKAAVSEGGENKRQKRKTEYFDPADQAALFCKMHPDAKPREGGYAPRDAGNIGYSTKMALQYLRHLGAEVRAVHPRMTYTLRALYDLNKERRDLRNHAVDAFCIAHFDNRVLIPLLDRLDKMRLPYEKLYRKESLMSAAHWDESPLPNGAVLVPCIEENMHRLAQVLPFIATAHRPDNRWNPGDPLGAGLGALGKENLYGFRPDGKLRKTLSDAVVALQPALKRNQDLTAREILDYLLHEPSDKKERKAWESLRELVKVRYRLRGTKLAEPKDSVEEASDKKGKKKPADRREYSLEASKPLKGDKAVFVNVESKFAIAAGDQQQGRRVLSIADILVMDETERSAFFARHASIYRPGDTICYEKDAFAVTGIMSRHRLIAYKVDLAPREKKDKHEITVGDSVTLERFPSDVLGRRLYWRRKVAGDLQQVPYPLRSQ